MKLNKKTSDSIQVTQPFLPPLKKYIPYLEEIWKKSNRETDDGLPIYSFKTLLEEHGIYMRNHCTVKQLNTKSDLSIKQYTELLPVQKRAFEQLNLYVQ